MTGQGSHVGLAAFGQPRFGWPVRLQVVGSRSRSPPGRIPKTTLRFLAPAPDPPGRLRGDHRPDSVGSARPSVDLARSSLPRFGRSLLDPRAAAQARLRTVGVVQGGGDPRRAGEARQRRWADGRSPPPRCSPGCPAANDPVRNVQARPRHPEQRRTGLGGGRGHEAEGLCSTVAGISSSRSAYRARAPR